MGEPSCRGRGKISERHSRRRAQSPWGRGRPWRPGQGALPLPPSRSRGRPSCALPSTPSPSRGQPPPGRLTSPQSPGHRAQHAPPSAGRTGTCRWSPPDRQKPPRGHAPLWLLSSFLALLQGSPSRLVPHSHTPSSIRLHSRHPRETWSPVTPCGRVQPSLHPDRSCTRPSLEQPGRPFPDAPRSPLPRWPHLYKHGPFSRSSFSRPPHSIPTSNTSDLARPCVRTHTTSRGCRQHLRSISSSIPLKNH